MAVACVHGIALLVLLPLPLAWWFKLAVAGAIGAQGVVTWRRHVTLAAPRAVTHLIWAAEDKWELFTADGKNQEARLLPMAYVYPLLVVLRFMTEDKRRCAVILPLDGLDADSHRRLRVQLRLRGGEPRQEH